jgi:hypothetical protein
VFYNYGLFDQSSSCCSFFFFLSGSLVELSSSERNALRKTSAWENALSHSQSLSLYFWYRSRRVLFGAGAGAGADFDFNLAAPSACKLHRRPCTSMLAPSAWRLRWCPHRLCLKVLLALPRFQRLHPSCSSRLGPCGFRRPSLPPVHFRPSHPAKPPCHRPPVSYPLQP